MVLTQTYSLITITSSPAITAFVADNTKALKLDVWHNCNKFETITVQANQISNGTLAITPAMLSMTGEFQNGVYRIRLKYLATTVVEDNGLVYMDKGINCDLIDLFSKHIDCLEGKSCDENYAFWAYAFHKILQDITLCDDLVYENTCILYNKLQTILNEEVDCGCN